MSSPSLAVTRTPMMSPLQLCRGGGRLQSKEGLDRAEVKLKKDLTRDPNSENYPYRYQTTIICNLQPESTHPSMQILCVFTSLRTQDYCIQSQHILVPAQARLPIQQPW